MYFLEKTISLKTKKKMIIKIQTENKNNFKRQTDEAAGYDITSNESFSLDPNERHAFSTGLYMEIPKGYFGKLHPRSGLAYKYGIHVLAGVIDSDYRGEIKVILVNLGNKTLHVKKGDRIAQMIINYVITPEKITIVDNIEENTERGANGFGSTG